MMKGNYQRRYLRAPYKERVLYADGSYVLSAKALNISEDGILISEIPHFPEEDEVPVLLRIPRIPVLKNFSLLKLQTFSPELYHPVVIRAQLRIARRGEPRSGIDNIFRSHFGLQFSHIEDRARHLIGEYVETFSSNLITLQTLIDSYNADLSQRERTRTMAEILGYNPKEKIAKLRLQVVEDYRNLQWM